VAFVLVITHHGRAGAGKWRAIRRGRTDRLDDPNSPGSSIIPGLSASCRALSVLQHERSGGSIDNKNVGDGDLTHRADPCGLPKLEMVPLPRWPDRGRNDAMIWPYSLTPPLLKDVQSQMPQAICEMMPNGGINTHLLVNREKPPFDNPDLRRAMTLSLDRKAFIDTLDQGHGDIGGVLQPPPEGLWGMPPELLKELPGYNPDVEKNRAQARQIMQKLGYGPDKGLPVKVSTRANQKRSCGSAGGSMRQREHAW
jgi:hypothetical protein